MTLTSSTWQNDFNMAKVWRFWRSWGHQSRLVSSQKKVSWGIQVLMRWTGRITFILWITMVRVWHDMNVQRIPNYIDMVSVPWWLPKCWSVASSVFKDPLTLTLASFVRQTHYFVFIHISFAIDRSKKANVANGEEYYISHHEFISFCVGGRHKAAIFCCFLGSLQPDETVWATYPDSWHWIDTQVIRRTPTSSYISKVEIPSLISCFTSHHINAAIVEKSHIPRYQTPAMSGPLASLCSNQMSSHILLLRLAYKASMQSHLASFPKP